MKIYLRLLKESVLFALNALRVNKLRTFLSLLGITIGIFSIISVFTLVDTLEYNIRSSIKELGENVIFVQKWPWKFGPDYNWWDYLMRPEVSLDDQKFIEENSDLASASAYVLSFQANLKQGSNSIEGAMVEASTEHYDEVRDIAIAKGRYFRKDEFIRGVPVAIIGSKVEEDLFSPFSGLDKFFKINGRKVQVVGVFEKTGESMIGFSMDEKVLIPVSYAKHLIDVNRRSTNPIIYVRAKEGVDNDRLIDELTGLMRMVRRLKPREDNNFALNEISLITQGLTGFFDLIHMLGLIIGGFSILVGGFSIANIMFVSVKERTHIIGIQKSLGAKNSFILFQFLSESIFLSLIGGIIGLALVSGLAGAVSVFSEYTVRITFSNIMTGILISVAIGLVSGIIPAMAAARKDPVEAIRSN